MEQPPRNRTLGMLIKQSAATTGRSPWEKDFDEHEYEAELSDPEHSDGEPGAGINISQRTEHPVIGNEDYSNFAPPPKQVEIQWAVLASYLKNDMASIQQQYVSHVEFSLALTHSQVKKAKREAYKALAFSVRDRLIERWKDTEIFFTANNVKRVNYLSLEFLMGRALRNSLGNLGLTENFSRALNHLGIVLEDLYDQETDAGLGNGGLGRLAACYLDSLATMNYPGWGYGLRYQYGMFMQRIVNGFQLELPDYWLADGNPWEIQRLDIQYPVRFYGTVKGKEAANNAVLNEHETIPSPSSTLKVEEKFPTPMVWEGGEVVKAVAFDVPIPGYNTFNTINLRLWSSVPSNEFDLRFFNQGNYFKAIETKQRSETITSVLYPNDNTSVGKELRLKQQYFFVSATIQDILARFKALNKPLSTLHEFMAIQLNDTHPSLGIAELMRILIDEKDMPWKEAWSLCKKVFSYTNHTVLPEALEKWPTGMMEHLLPRIMKIIYDINYHFLLEVQEKWPNDIQKMKRLSLIEEEPVKQVRMANLAIIGSHHVNGVAAIHSGLITTDVFPMFFALYPERFTNVTNGVTPRRWIAQANPHLAKLISKTLKGDEWQTDLTKLKGLMKYQNDEKFQGKWRHAKLECKKKLANYIYNNLGIKINPNALFDVQVKRIHEYKRQLMNIIGVCHRYRQLKGMSEEELTDVVPRVYMYGGKAAPGYWTAKLVIKLITMVADLINNDPDINELMKVVFIPNYNVSLAEMIIPASDISEHISTAGMEASGTSNMKFAMNGGLIIGTMDGANIEIREEIGAENVFTFGTLTEDVPKVREQIRKKTLKQDPRWLSVLETIRVGTFGQFDQLQTLLNSVTGSNDWYILSADFASYIETQDKIDEVYKDVELWTKKSIASTALMGKFSSDRSIIEYADKIWNVKPLPRPGPISVDTQAIPGSSTNEFYMSPTLSSPGQHPEIALERLSPEDKETIISASPPSQQNFFSQFST